MKENAGQSSQFRWEFDDFIDGIAGGLQQETAPLSEI